MAASLWAGVQLLSRRNLRFASSAWLRHNRSKRSYRHDRRPRFGYSAGSTWENFAARDGKSPLDAIRSKKIPFWLQFSSSADRHAVLDRSRIESTLRQIQAGELSPDEATELLLGLDLDLNDAVAAAGQQVSVSDLDADRESLIEMIDRLGPPPPEIVDAWCDQLASIAAQHQSADDGPLPAIDWRDCELTDQGELVWNGIAAGGQDSGELSGAAQKLIANFRESLSPAVAPEPTFAPQASAQPTPKPTAKAKPRLKPVWRTVATISAIAVCGVIALFVVRSATRDEPAAVAQKSNAVDPAGANVFDFSNSTDAKPAVSRETIAELERFETLDEAQLLAEEQKAKSAAPSFSLDAMMPSIGSGFPSDGEVSSVPPIPDVPLSLSTGPDPPDPASQTVAPEQAGEALEPTPTQSMPTLGKSIDDDAAPPDETEQDTQLAASAESVVRHIELPDDDADLSAEPFLISEQPLGELSIDFPFDVPVVVRRDGDAWSIDDTRKEVAIAKLTPSGDGVAMVWADTAGQSASLASLHHGRLQDNAGNQIYLRPIVSAEPFKLKLASTDVMPTWNLREPIGRQTRLAIDFDLPDDVEFGWIEPVQADELKRTRALAVLTPQDDEGVALGIRFDIRCSRKLSMRIRYGGRLDSSMPWQTVSTSGVAAFADQLAYQAGLVSQEATRLSGVYDIAGSLGRRVIRAKQQRNDQLADDIRKVADRVASLQSMMAKVDAGGELKISVHAEWPDTTQPILTMD